MIDQDDEEPGPSTASYRRAGYVGRPAMPARHKQ